jgi:VWFA-related protein
MSVRGFIVVLLLAGVAAAAAGLPRPAAEPAPEPFVSIRFAEPRIPYLSGLEKIVLEVEVPDGDRIDRVDLFIDGELTQEARRPPFRFEHDFGPVGKAHVLLALVFTRNGEFRSRPTPIVHQVEVKLVQLTTTVVDADGTHVTDLGKEDFQVFETGVEQKIAFFDRGETPCSIALALDCSGSMKHRLWRAQKAAGDFLRALPAHYRISVMGFNDTVFLTQDFTVEKRPLIYAINQLQAEGETALYEAIRASSLHLRGHSDRRAVVLFTDGQESFYRQDEEGEEKLAEVLEAANLAQVNFFAIGYGGDFTADLLTRIAEDTGGRFFPAEGGLRLEEVYGDISTILESQYTLAYYPSPPPPPREWRSIEVRVRPKGLRVRARKGYYSAPR